MKRWVPAGIVRRRMVSMVWAGHVRYCVIL